MTLKSQTQAGQVVSVNISDQTGTIKKPVPEITDTGERTFGESIENIPDPDAELEEGDVLVVVGHDKHIAAIAKG